MGLENLAVTMATRIAVVSVCVCSVEAFAPLMRAPALRGRPFQGLARAAVRPRSAHFAGLRYACHGGDQLCSRKRVERVAHLCLSSTPCAGRAQRAAPAKCAWVLRGRFVHADVGFV